MRNIILSRSVAGVFVIAVAAMSLNEAAARFRPIVGVSRSTLKSRCAADGGEFGTGHGGEYAKRATIRSIATGRAGASAARPSSLRATV